jgi:type IV pilus assembly protein PilY1
MDLPTSGERGVTDAVVRGDHVFFNTAIPTTDPCGSGGDGWQMIVKINNGGRPDSVAFDLNGDGLLGVLDEISGEAAAGAKVRGLPSSPVTLGTKRYTSTTESIDGASITVDDIEKIGGVDTGRLSWEELAR